VREILREGDFRGGSNYGCFFYFFEELWLLFVNCKKYTYFTIGEKKYMLHRKELFLVKYFVAFVKYLV